MSEPHAFINYRSIDTGATASRLADALAREFAEDQIFIDHSNIEPGRPWADELKTKLARSNVVLVLIGDRWLDTDDSGRRLVECADDWVGREIVSSVQSAKTTVVPVYVDGVEPPSRDTFPDHPVLSDFVALQGLRLRRKDWAADLQGIVNFLVQHGFKHRAGALRVGTLATIPDQELPTLQSSSRSPIRTRRHTILVVGSTPDGEPPVAASREYQAIDDTFDRRAGLAAQYRPQSSIEDLRKQILRRRPTIVHFIGHGTPDGELVFVHDDESPQLPPLEAAARAFATRSTVKCVVLNACHSLAQAQVIARHVSLVIGVRGDRQQWHDEAALAFTRAFYLGINEELSAQRAFELGRDALVDLGVDPELVVLVEGEDTSAANIFLHSPPVPGIVDAAIADLDDGATARLLSIATEGLRALFHQANAARQGGEFERAHGLFRDAHAQARELAEAADGEADELEALLGLTQLAYAVSLLHVGEEAKAIDQLIALAKRVLGSTPAPDLAWCHRLVETLLEVRQPALAAMIVARWSSVPPTIAAMLAVERGELPSGPGADATPRLRAHMALHHDRAGDVDASAELALALLDDDETELEVLANAVLVLGRAIVQTALGSPRLHRPLAPERRRQAVLRFSAGLATARASMPQMAPATRTTLNEIAAEVQRHTFDTHGLVRSLRALGHDVATRKVGIALAHEGTAWSEKFRSLLDAKATGEAGEAFDLRVLEFGRSHPTVSVVQWLVGWFLSDPERPWRALPYAEAAHALLPGLGQAILLAELLTRCQREDEAAQLLEPWLPLSSENPGLLRTAAFALRASRQLESCRHFERYFALDDAVPIEDNLAYAELLTQLDREPEAVELARAAQASDAASRDPLVLFEVARILATAAPPGRKTRAELRAIHQRLATDYPSHALVERLLVEIYFMLGAPTDLPAPDVDRLIAEGVAWGASFDHGVEGLRAWTQLRTQAHAAWRAGMFSFAALRRTAAVETADVLERLLVRSSAEPVLVPPFLRPRVAGETPVVAGQLILLGDLEVHLLVELELWPELLDRLGPDGHLAMFDDVWREHVHAAVLRLAARNDRLAHDRVARLRDLLDRTTKLEWVSEPGPHAVVVSNNGPDQDARWSLEALLATLAGRGWLLRDELEPLGIDVERQHSELPDHIYLDEGVIEDLWRGEQLENVLCCDAIRRVEVARSTREGIVARVEVHELGAKAVERAKRVRRVMIEALDRGRLEIVERPSVDLPPPAARRWTMFHQIAVELRSWRQFLVERPRALMLSADHATSAGSTRGPVGLEQTLAWTSRDQLERALEAHRGLGERVLDFAELVAELAPPARSFETAIGLVGLGFSAALEPRHILDLGLQHRQLGLAAPRAQRVLKQYEWPARTNLDSLASTQFHVCHNYAGAIWLAWCGDAGSREPVPDAFASSFSTALAQRVADLAAEELCQLNWRLFMWLQIAAIQSPLYGAVDGHGVPYVDREPGPGDRVLFSADTPAGRLWAWLGGWIAGHPARARAWNLALQHTVAFCARWRHDYAFVRDAIASLRLAVAIVGGSDEPHLARPPLCHLVLLAFTCDQPRKVLTMHQFANPVSGQPYSWWDVLRGVSTNDIDALRHGVASASLEDGAPLLSAEVPTALLASEPSPQRSEALTAWAYAVAPFDARLATAAVRLAEVGEPGDREAFVRVLAESPARSADDDPLGPSGWGLAGDVTFPKSLDEVVQLLGEDQPRTSVRAAVPTAWRLGRSCLSPFEGGRRPSPELSERARTWLAAPTGELSSTLMFAAAVSVAQFDGPPATPAESAAQLLARALEAERAGAQRHEIATTAQLEWRLLGLAKTVIVRLSQDRRDELPAQRVLELSWSLFWWWWRRLHLIPEPARGAAFDCLVRRTEPTELERASEGFVLDPDRFGPGKWNHRLAGLLAGALFGHELASQFADHQPDMLASASLEAELVALLAWKPTPTERAEHRRRQTAPSPLGWFHDVAIRDLALGLLLETQPGALSRLPRLQRDRLIRRSFSRGLGRLTPQLRRAVLRAAIRDDHLPELQWAFLRSSSGRVLGRPAYLTRRYTTRRYRNRRYSVLDRAGRSSSKRRI